MIINKLDRALDKLTTTAECVEAANKITAFMHNENCITGMTKIKDGSIDAIICDPPYNISKENNFKTMGLAGIDFGVWDKDFDLTSWLDVALHSVIITCRYVDES